MVSGKDDPFANAKKEDAAAVKAVKDFVEENPDIDPKGGIAAEVAKDARDAYQVSQKDGIGM